MVPISKFYELYKEKELPKLKELIQETEIDDKKIILDYLKKGTKSAASPSKMKDLITGEEIPGTLFSYNDGNFFWRTDIVYYFEKYNLKLDDNFLQYVRNLHK